LIDQYRDRQTVHSYRILWLWEQDPAILLSRPALLPLAVLAFTEAPETLLREVSQRVARIEDSQERSNLTGCAEVLAGLRFEKDLIQQLFREDIMRESVIYQDILQQGVQEGLQQGLQQGQKQEAFTLVMRLLTRRLGELEPTLQEKVQGLSLAQVEALGEALLDFSQMADLVTWLEQAASIADR